MSEPTPPFAPITGQHVTETKRIVAQELRRQLTPTEKTLWAHLRRSQQGANFRRQQILDDFIADFFCRPALLVVEVDGAVHDAAYDCDRDRIFAARGIQTLQFTNDEVEQHLPQVLSHIRQALAQAETPPPPSGPSP